MQATRAASRPVARGRMVVAAAAQRGLWAPGVAPPSYLDGTLPGEYICCEIRVQFASVYFFPPHLSSVASSDFLSNPTKNVQVTEDSTPSVLELTLKRWHGIAKQSSSTGVGPCSVLLVSLCRPSSTQISGGTLLVSPKTCLQCPWVEKNSTWAVSSLGSSY